MNTKRNTTLQITPTKRYKRTTIANRQQPKKIQRRKQLTTPSKTRKVRNDPMWNTCTIEKQRVNCAFPGVPMGTGSMHDPYRIPLRMDANASGCVHCPLGIDRCDCLEIETLISTHLHRLYTTSDLRRTHAYGRHPLNSKSVLPVFVSRLIRVCTVQQSDVVWDLGCGIGSVVMQFALQTGANSIGVDIQGENITIARKTWQNVRREWVQRYPERPVGNAVFITNDIFEELEPHVARRSLTTHHTDRSPETPAPTVVWAANLLFTPAMNNQLAHMLHRIKPLRAVACMLDLYPHNRAGASMKRNPEPYNKFPCMEDHIAQADCFEWREPEKRPFYTYQTTKGCASKIPTSV